MASLVATTSPLTGSVLIQLDRILAQDTFTRVVANSWGTPNNGAAYVQTGGVAANFSVNGTRGVHATTTTGAVRMTTTAPGTTDGEFSLGWQIPVNPTVASIGAGLVIRGTGTSYYVVENNLNPSGSLELRIVRSVAGVLTTISDTVVLPGFTASASQDITIWADVQGTKIRASMSRTGQPRPEAYMVEANDATFASGSIGAWSIRNTGNTNGTVNVSFDDLAVLAGAEPLTLVRVTPDAARAVVRGSGFYTEPSWNSPFLPSGTAVIWDNEAPFDVDVFYALRSASSATEVLTSNTVNLASDGLGWLRDPYVPANNISFETTGDLFDFCDDAGRIMFAGLPGFSSPSASGVFEIIDASRPDTVAQLRKRYGSTLALISKELSDVDAIEVIIAGGYPLLLSLPNVYGFGRPYGTDWITVFDVDWHPLGTDLRVPARIWSLPFRLSTPAADVDTGNTGGNGIGGGDATFDVLAASAIGLTFNALTASGFTFNQIAAGTGY